MVRTSAPQGPQRAGNDKASGARRVGLWLVAATLGFGACGSDDPDTEGDDIVGMADAAIDTSGDADTAMVEDTAMVDEDTAVAPDTACTPDCTDRTCGDDGCGGDCGACGAGETCIAGDCAAATTCPPPPPYGTNVGDTVPDITLTDCDGTSYSLHELCAKKASYIYMYTGW